MTDDHHCSRSPDPWRPGSWEPGRFGVWDSIAITSLLVLVALVRGWDYLTPAYIHSPGLSVVEQAFPLHVWGFAFALPALGLATSVLTRIHAGVWLGHWLLAITYVALAVGLAAEYTTRPWFDGIRSSTAMVLPAAIHLAVAIRTGWRPPRWSRTTSHD